MRKRDSSPSGAAPSVQAGGFQRVSILETRFFQPFLRAEELADDPQATINLARTLAAAESTLDQGAAQPRNQDQLHDEIHSALVLELENSIKAEGDTAWTPSIRLNLADHYMSRLQRTPALAHYQAAWELTKTAQSGNGKQIADAALAHYTRALVLLGRIDELTQIYQQYGSRILDGGDLTQMWQRTFEKYIRMQKYVEDSYKCGIYALDRIAARYIGVDNFNEADLLRTPGKPEGFSLLELSQIAPQAGLQLTPVVRENSGDLIVPSVIHFRQDHYAAILDEFQRFVTPTISDNLDEARGFGLHLTMAHQFPNQLLDRGENGRRVYNSVMENASSKVVFRLSHEDNLKAMAQWLFMGVMDPDQVKHEIYSTQPESWHTGKN